MSRLLRIQQAGGWHHVMNRASGGRDLFLDDVDREDFLSLVADCRSRFVTEGVG